MRKSLFAFVALLTTTASAFAADLGPYRSVKDQPAPAYDYAPAFLWAGPYVGAQVGYTWGKANHDFASGFAGNSDPEGFVGGGHLGYNWQRGRFVFGVEADFEGGDVSGNFNQPLTFGSADLNWQGSVRGRVGLAADRALFYATGGWAFADYDFTGATLAGCCGFSDTLNGWTVGGGIEYAFTPNTTVRVEYRYADFGNVSSGLSPADRMDVDLQTHTVRLGASYKF